MIISRKRFNKEIQEAVNKALCEQHERRLRDDRLRDMDRWTDERFNRLYDRVEKLEKAVFPGKHSNDEKVCANVRG